MALVVFLPRGVNNRNGSIAIFPAPSRESPLQLPGQSALDFFRQLLRYIESIRPCTAANAWACSDSESIP